MNTKHTPGPWVWMHPGGDYCCLIRDDTSEGVIGVCIEVDIEKNNALVAKLDLAEADARLIASAPEMFDLMVSLALELDSREQGTLLVELARKLIAKVEGE